MVKRPKSKIVSKPPTPPPLPEADDWVIRGGQDPEIQTTAPASKEQSSEPPTEASEPKGKAFPHRISFDTDRNQYRRLKRAAFEEERALTEIVREAVEEWLKARNY